jgi:hypothetical protein
MDMFLNVCLCILWLTVDYDVCLLQDVCVLMFAVDGVGCGESEI